MRDETKFRIFILALIFSLGVFSIGGFWYLTTHAQPNSIYSVSIQKNGG